MSFLVVKRFGPAGLLMVPGLEVLDFSCERDLASAADFYRQLPGYAG